MFQENVILSRFSNYKIGGPAKYFFEAKNVEETIKALDKWSRLYSDGRVRIAEGRRPEARYSHAIFILAGGTNVLINDEGFNGLILKPNIQFIKEERDLIRVGAGVPITELLNYSITKSFSDLEWAAGIPGTIGGAIYGNAGAFGGEMKDIIKEVVSLDISGKKPKIIKRSQPECRFDYRHSIFKKKGNQEIIIEAAIYLRKGDKKRIQEIMEANMDYRRQKQPLEYPSIGSIFKNVGLKKAKEAPKIPQNIIKTDPFPVIPAAFLVSEAGLKGISCGGAMISPKHPNFIVNVLGATANDVKNLIALAKKKVYNEFKIKLEEEVVRL